MSRSIGCCEDDIRILATARGKPLQLPGIVIVFRNKHVCAPLRNESVAAWYACPMREIGGVLKIANYINCVLWWNCIVITTTVTALPAADCDPNGLHGGGVVAAQ